MEMLPPSASLIRDPIRPLKRVEYDELVARGHFDDEKVELLFGMVVEMSPIDRAHIESTNRVRRVLELALNDRAKVDSPAVLAASEISEPEPDVMVVPSSTNWEAHPSTAFLVVEVARSSLDRDQRVKTTLYALAHVEEYWIVNHVDGVVEVYRDSREGEWRTKTTHARGEQVSMLRFPDVVVDVTDILPPA